MSGSERGTEDGALRLELARDADAPALARAAVAGFCDGQKFSSGTMATLRLLVSEIVTNAVVHPDVDPSGEIELRARIDGDAVRIEVSDAGPGFVPVARDPRRLSGGYGLYLLEKASARWGVTGTPRTTVWFEVPAG